MSRSGYDDDCDQWDLIRYRGAVASAMRGARGQALLCDLLKALDRLPERKLIVGELVEQSGAVCALGALGKERGINMETLDAYDAESVANVFGIAPSLAREIVYENDEHSYREAPEQRFERMRKWVESSIAPVDESPPPRHA